LAAFTPRGTGVRVIVDGLPPVKVWLPRLMGEKLYVDVSGVPPPVADIVTFPVPPAGLNEIPGPAIIWDTPVDPIVSG